MAKIMIGPNADGGTYSFNKTAKTVTITLPSGRAPSKENLLLITDAENGTIIYNFADQAKGATLSGKTYTLEYDTNTGAFNDNDALQIWYYDSVPQSVEIDDLAVALKVILGRTNRASESSGGRQRVIIEEGIINLINAITTIATVTNVTQVANPGFRVSDDMLNPWMNSNFNDKVRTKIS